MSPRRTPGASRNTRDLPDGVPDASPVGQPRLRGRPVGALREVRQGPHRPVAQAGASCAPQRAIAPARRQNCRHLHTKAAPGGVSVNEEAANRACAKKKETQRRHVLRSLWTSLKYLNGTRGGGHKTGTTVCPEGQTEPQSVALGPEQLLSLAVAHAIA